MTTGHKSGPNLLYSSICHANSTTLCLQEGSAHQGIRQVQTTTCQSTCMYFPKRLELSLRTVLAFPKASRIGFDSNTCCSMVPSSVEPVLLPRIARYFMMILHVSVLPAPDSPLTKMDFWGVSQVTVVKERERREKTQTTGSGDREKKHPSFHQIFRGRVLGIAKTLRPYRPHSRSTEPSNPPVESLQAPDIVEHRGLRYSHTATQNIMTADTDGQTVQYSAVRLCCVVGSVSGEH